MGYRVVRRRADLLRGRTELVGGSPSRRVMMLVLKDALQGKRGPHDMFSQELIRGIVTDRGPDFDHAASVGRVRRLCRDRSCATIEAMELLLENLPPSLRDQTDAIRECLLAFDKVMPLRAVYLFGSHARGDARADSDVDLCLVSDGAGNQLDAAAQFRRATRDIRPKPSFTLVPITPARLKEKQERGDHFFQTVLREGRRLGA